MESKRNISGEAFLHSKQPSLHVGPVVQHEQDRRERAGEEAHSKPADKVADWMEVLVRTHGHDDPRVLERIKQGYHRTYVIKPEQVPESAFLLEQRIARNLGHGEIPITDEFRHAKTAEIISNQVASLDKWLDYLTSDDAIYPPWAKYWAFTSITKMGKFEKVVEAQEDGTEKESARFAKRTASTTAPFPPLNPRALALTIGVMQEKLRLKGAPKEMVEGRKRPQAPRVENVSTKLTDEEFQTLLSSESFSEIYTQFLIELPQYSTEGLQETSGEWRVYSQGSDPKPLVDSLDGYPLEWCTANEDTARTQLEGGDFYIYYSLDQDGNPTIPRAAIRMQLGSIAEVRGIAPNQNLDPYIGDIVAEKMAEFPDGESYQKKAADMARVTEIEERIQQGGELTTDDFRFLYEVDGKIECFGYQDDPRVAALLQGRDTREDLVRVFNCRPEQISLSAIGATLGTAENPILFHYRDLNLDNLTTAEGLTLPQTIGGSLDLHSLTSAEGLTLPQTVGGSLNLCSLTTAEGLTLPQTVGDGLNLDSLTTAEGLTLPQTIYGSLDLRGLTTAEGLTLPQTVGGSLDLCSLTTAEGLTLPQTVGGSLYLDNLTTAEGLTLPQTVGGRLDMTFYQGGGAGGYVRVSGLNPDQLKAVLVRRPDLVAKVKDVPPWILTEITHSIANLASVEGSN